MRFDILCEISGTIARKLAMSVSEFHHHFQVVTTLSRVKFQKRLQGTYQPGSGSDDEFR
jgi:hypothetical protein